MVNSLQTGLGEGGWAGCGENGKGFLRRFSTGGPFSLFLRMRDIYRGKCSIRLHG